MATEFHMRVRELLEAALQRGAQERTAYVRRAAGEDAALLREALALLPHYATRTGRTRLAPWMERPTVFNGMAAALFNDVEWTPPFCITPYTVVETIGDGGMGVVYRALDPIRSAEVAIKVLRRRLMSAEDRRRFQHEQELLRQLKHPGIVRFLHGGVASGVPQSGRAHEQRPYFVMELVHGQSLIGYCAAHSLNPLQRLDLLIQICDALDYAHHRSVIHLDLKPDNIRVDPRGQTRVLDFGIARLQCPDGGEGERRGFAGTPAYASPEQRAGEPLSPASDVFTMGVITHELLTGRRPARNGARIGLDLSTVGLPGEHVSSSGSFEFRSALHTILSGALRRPGAHAYRDAGELGHDLADVRKAFSAARGWRGAWQRVTGRAPRKAEAPRETHSRLLATLLGQRIQRNLGSGRRPG